MIIISNRNPPNKSLKKFLESNMNVRRFNVSLSRQSLFRSNKNSKDTKPRFYTVYNDT